MKIVPNNYKGIIMTIKRIQWIETTLFFIGTLSFFYWEANHPLPKEFMILGIVIFILSLMQHLYLGDSF